MNRKIFTLLLSVVAVALLLAPAGRTLADDESDEVQIEIKAPLDAAACDVAPQTITVFGLTIDVTNAQFDIGSGDESSEDAPSVVPATCADLVVGRTVQVQLTGDVPPLIATEVGQENNESDDEDEIQIKAPIQALDTAIPPTTITLLGLPIDISSAEVEGCDDEDDDGSNQGIDPATLMIGQFVEVELDRNALPALVARDLEVKNFANTVEIDVEDASGNDVDDVDDDGQPVPTVTVDVTESVRSAASTASGKGSKGSKGSNRTLRFRAQSNGRVVLHGLPTGRARVNVTRSAAGSTSSGRGALTIAPNSTTSTAIRLKGSKGSKSK